MKNANRATAIKRGDIVRAMHDGQWYPATYVATRASGEHRIVWADGGEVAEVATVESLSEIAKGGSQGKRAHRDDDDDGLNEQYDASESSSSMMVDHHGFKPHSSKGGSHRLMHTSYGAPRSVIHKSLEHDGFKPQSHNLYAHKSGAEARIGENVHGLIHSITYHHNG